MTDLQQGVASASVEGGARLIQALRGGGFVGRKPNLSGTFEARRVQMARVSLERLAGCDVTTYRQSCAFEQQKSKRPYMD